QTPTLFPYTTLFRSEELLDHGVHRPSTLEYEPAQTRQHFVLERRVHTHSQIQPARRARRFLRWGGHGQRDARIQPRQSLHHAPRSEEHTSELQSPCN